MVIWVTGLSGSGKTTLCNAIVNILKPKLKELVLLDGDMVRSAFGNDLKYREEDRVIQIKRLQNISKLLIEQDITVIVAALYSNPELLRWNRENLDKYFEAYIEVSIDILRKRDPKGLYAMVDSGQITDVVGIDIPWHAPEFSDLLINNDDLEKPEVLARRLIAANIYFSNIVD